MNIKSKEHIACYEGQLLVAVSASDWWILNAMTSWTHQDINIASDITTLRKIPTIIWAGQTYGVGLVPRLFMQQQKNPKLSNTQKKKELY